MTQPGKVKCYLDTKILRDFVWKTILDYVDNNWSNLLCKYLPRGWRPRNCLTQDFWRVSRLSASCRGYTCHNTPLLTHLGTDNNSDFVKAGYERKFEEIFILLIASPSLKVTFPTLSPFSALILLRKWRRMDCLSALERNFSAASMLTKLAPVIKSCKYDLKGTI